MNDYTKKTLIKSRESICDEIRKIYDASEGLSEDSLSYANCIMQRLKQCRNDIDIILAKEGAVI